MRFFLSASLSARMTQRALFLLVAGLVLVPDGALANHVETRDVDTVVVGGGGGACGTPRSFAAGSLIIPMDGCYQRTMKMDDAYIVAIFGDSAANLICNKSGEKDDGLIHATGVITRLIRAGIPVYWALKSGKATIHEVDFSVTLATGGPVTRMSPPTLVEKATYGARTQMDYRGAPFIIDAANAAAARLVLAGLPLLGTGNPKFPATVDLHVAKTSFSSQVCGPITTMPKLAILNVDEFTSGKTFRLLGYPEEAYFEPQGSWWFVMTTAELLANRLVTDSFDMLWLPPFKVAETGPTAREASILGKINEYSDLGGYVLAADSAIEAIEGHGDASGGVYFPKQAPTLGFQTQGGVLCCGITTSWGDGNPCEQVVTDDASDPLGQFGGIFWTGVGGITFSWHDLTPPWVTVDPKGYRAGVHRLVTSDDCSDPTKDGWDMVTWRYKDNDPLKGVIHYIGGEEWKASFSSGLRVFLNGVSKVGLDESGGGGVLTDVDAWRADMINVSRSAPTVAQVNGTTVVFQGSFDNRNPRPRIPVFQGASDTRFFFPYTAGHMRAIEVSPLGVATVALDASTGIPPVSPTGCTSWFGTGCRTIFTHTATTANPARVYLKTDAATAAALQPLMLPTMTATDTAALITRVLAGRPHPTGGFTAELGGIDRSTVAVIGTSPLIQTLRPQMAYVGALDGMLHAFCAEVAGACTALGKELWAFLPRVQLGLLRNNRQRIEGSPKVFDVFGGTGADRKWRTVLTFQTGFQDTSDPLSSGAVYALDITDPADPKIMWEKLTRGVGMTLSAGPVKTTTGTRTLVFVQTGLASGGPGTDVLALDAMTGNPVWTWTYLYPAPRNPLNPPVLASAVPGGASAIDLVGGYSLTHVVVPTLYGDLFVLDATTGANVYGSVPLFSFSTDFHPVGAPLAVYRDSSTGDFRAIVVSGGYVDTPLTWSPTSESQYVVSVSLKTPQALAPLDESTVVSKGLGYVTTLPPGQRAFAQAVISGNELFVVTDPDDVNAATYGTAATSGTLLRYSLSGLALKGTQALETGAASVDVSGSTVYATGDATATRTEVAGFDSSGSSGTELVSTAKWGRRVWLSLQ
jgi:hypothetical protein